MWRKKGEKCFCSSAHHLLHAGSFLTWAVNSAGKKMGFQCGRLVTAERTSPGPFCGFHCSTLPPESRMGEGGGPSADLERLAGTRGGENNQLKSKRCFHVSGWNDCWPIGTLFRELRGQRWKIRLVWAGGRCYRQGCSVKAWNFFYLALHTFTWPRARKQVRKSNTVLDPASFCNKHKGNAKVKLSLLKWPYNCLLVSARTQS